MGSRLQADLEYIFAQTQSLWNELKETRIFITGGTGFVGCWLLESFLYANEELGLNAQAIVLTRDGQAFRKKAPHLASRPAISLHEGDVRSFSFPNGEFSHVIHAAADASPQVGVDDPLTSFDTIAAGTRRVLEFARTCGAGKFLLTSSGAVYGKQPPPLTHLSEEYSGAPDTLGERSAYGEGKRAAEFLCSAYGRTYGIQTKIARCFAFVGPYLPLDAQYAIGNFIGDGIRRRPVHVKGDGTPYRSYLYAADLAVWLWTILFLGKPQRAYNVGSEEAISIADLASTVAKAFGSESRVVIDEKAEGSSLPERYIPSTARAREELGLRQNIDLEEAIRRTINWHGVEPAET
ncbi:MAG: NAD-dependent epimerase/dehydratase family protein [Smithellaceae bacterium]|nr:NAD-dependent epimerase/dehydratase family protein [Smithellaceae bacterium]